MLLRAQKYDVNLEYRPGRNVEIADTLSRAFLTDVKPTEFEASVESINMLQFLPIASNRLGDIQHHTAQDRVLVKLKVLQKSVPESLVAYFDVRDELSVQNGIVFKGNRAVIPQNLRKDMLERIHASHIGIEGCLRRARESVYWPRMNSEVKDFIEKCETCRCYDQHQRKEPIEQHDVPLRAWAKVGLDIFTFEDKNYLIASDYYSNFFEIDLLESTKSKTVINKLRSQFARHGIPDTFPIMDRNLHPRSSEISRNDGSLST
ncbi:hypothetical protein FSP39_024657 [Pinctada imbricata]|uniref:Integrase zinc-binding domain-containing protein n=1 Tax=Pinctada imbricata TaxID=66713 RepID=A0AA89BN37_PINIB|nr:hypothetical protein FSP39_024657 [Pinctada imbricata]